jgi:hypothetical protein
MTTIQNRPEFVWRKGSHMKGDPQATGEALEALRDPQGNITTEMVRAEARANPGSVFRVNMTWDMAEALDKVQLIEAGKIISSVEVITVRGEQRIQEREWLSIRETETATLRPLRRTFQQTSRVARSRPHARSALAILLAQMKGIERSVEDLIRAVADEGQLDHVGLPGEIYSHLQEIRLHVGQIENLAEDL